MGMSASQVRFLSLQNRKSDIGRRLTDLSNRKMSLSRDMNKVSRNYTEALNQKMLKWSNDSGATYKDLSYGLMMKPNEVNTSKPYIISDRNGRVVVDSTNDIMAGVIEKYHDEKGEMLAKSFSANAYVPAELQGKDITYENIARWITTVGGGTITTSDDGVVTGSGTEVKMVTLGDGSVKKSSAYVIPNGTNSYNFDDTLRFQIFQEMGILSQQSMDKYNEILTKLYGSQAAKDMGYGVLLKQFDLNGKQPINGINYNDIFGEFDMSNPDAFDINPTTGCAMGNLALAQAYLSEYKNFLNTPMKVGIKTEVDNDLTDLGVSDRIAEFLGEMSPEQVSNVDGLYIYKTPTLVEQLKDRKIDETTTSDGSATIVAYYHNDGDVRYCYYNGSEYVGNDCLKDEAVLTNSDYARYSNWGSMYEDQVAVRVNRTNGAYTYDDTTRKTIKGIIEGYANALTMSKTAGGAEVNKIVDTENTYSDIPKQATAYATDKTYELFKDDHSDVSQHHGADSPEFTAAEKSNEVFSAAGKRWHNTHDRTVFVATNRIMDAFNTFYQAYFEAADSVLKSGGAINVNSYLGYDPNLGMVETSSKQLIDTLNDTFMGYNYYLVEPTTSDDGFQGSETQDDKVIYNFKGKDENDQDITYSITVEKDSTNGNIKKITEKSNDVTTAESEYQYDNDEKVKSIETDFKNGYKNTVTFQYDADNKISSTTSTITSNPDVSIDPTGINKANKVILTMFIDGSYTEPQVFYNSRQLSSTLVLSGDESVNSYKSKYGDYEIISNDADNSTLADQYISTYPEDLYSKKFQALVDKCQARVDELLEQLENFFAGAEGKMMEYFDAIFQRISDEGWVADSKASDNNQYLNNKLQNNDYFVTVCEVKADESGFKYTNKMANMITKIFEVNDDNSVNIALSKYEADKTLIQSKERKIDAMMVKLETEQEAVNTELQSIEKVRDQNIERTFKIFA